MTVSTRTRALWFSTAVAAGVGGLLGGGLWELGTLRLVFVAGVGAFFGVLFALGWITRPVAAAPSPVVRQATAGFPPAPGRSDPVRLPERQAAVEKQGWWERDSLPTPVPKEMPGRQEFDARRARIAQCPHCAGFELDVHRVERGYAFRCRNAKCCHRWEWELGTAWPAVVVRRNLTGRPPG
ncbi:hypothetical protein ACFFQW_29685 [Umezawaea endophytica]|uniref:Uncharacterized protein n=1 Tax=Umezawaea endophytica TaxID=1654476 RepID=A0A9X2ZYW0_9PSEU|nr:hypothetical protein [Umezawaea endophytica]MCS7475288.1 hypothetical protein [Umezawaea endophytica]